MAMLGEQYEQTIAEMLQKQSVSDNFILDHPSQLNPPQIHLDEAQEHESTQLGDRLQHELDILTAYQSKSRMAADSQRTRERRELEVPLEFYFDSRNTKLVFNQKYCFRSECQCGEHSLVRRWRRRVPSSVRSDRFPFENEVL